MHIVSIRPSTVDGIKQLATKLKREKQVTHTSALDLASQQAGFDNFVHARRELRVSKARYGIYLSAHWFNSPRNDQQTGRRAGREILFVELQKPLPEVVAKHRVPFARGLGGFRMEYDDHLEHLTNLPSQDDARRALLQASRSLRFIDASGLQPITTRALREATRVLHGLPGKDHTSQWFDPNTAGWIVLDEPYNNAVKGDDEKRRAWLGLRGLHLRQPSWEGLYYPEDCSPHLIGPDPNALALLSTKLEALHPTRAPDHWPFETGRNGDDFVSPNRKAAGKPRKPRLNRSYRDHKGARPYGGRAGIPSRWRPIESLPLAQHRELGVLFAAFACVPFGWRVRSKLEHFQSALEDWALIEHGDAAPSDLYYGNTTRRVLQNEQEIVEALRLANGIVETGYNVCKPREELLAAINAAADQASTLDKRHR